jgi:hypothetical protein
MNQKKIDGLMKEILKFRDKRDWAQVHDLKTVMGFSLDGKSLSGKLINS